MTDSSRQRGRERRESQRGHVADSWVNRSAFDRCILGFNAGPPITPGGYNQNLQLFQTPDHVVLVAEMVHTARVVPLDGRPVLTDGIRQWSGDSRGHWEGDTPGGRDLEFQRGETVEGVDSQYEAGRALHTHRRRHAGV